MIQNWLRPFPTRALPIATLLPRGEKKKKNREEDPQESNAFGCTIPCSKGLNTVLIITSYNLSSDFRNCPTSRLPAVGNFDSC